ncbi:hypothetical protein [uncultured Maribacter sp.]|uniref:hypothetical protein n=1 Tax=uncultured Maribacter sp. TaxID=431308 RepID=UPI002608A7A3|nr:hypothetical protein [uncultured Maribacter sp.]
MVKSFFLPAILFFAITFKAYSQDMSPEKLEDIITKIADTTNLKGNSIQFIYNRTMLVCVYDENANRMRIISPIIEFKKLEEEQILNSLVANFHSALDVKYALSDEIIWSVFIHPLKELTAHQVEDAIKQVYNANITFGSTYSSTNLVFPGNTKKEEKTPEKKLIERF